MLRLSEDAAVRRVMAARFVRQFPALLPAIAAGELHLTGLLMLGPHLTRDNHLEVLACAKHRTKKEIAKLVRVLDPLPEVPASIEVLGPERPRSSRATWEQHVASFCPGRELPPGDRPRDWMNEPCEPSAPAAPARRIAGLPRDLAPRGPRDALAEPLETSAPVRITGSPAKLPSSDYPRNWMDQPLEGSAPAMPAQIAGLPQGLASADGSHPRTDGESSEVSARARIIGPLRFKVQFTATEEFVELIERARALLSQRRGPASIDQIQLEALRLFVTSLEKKRYGASERRKPQPEPSPEPSLKPEPTTEPTLDSEPESMPTSEPILEPESTSEPRSRSRHVPALARRAVFERDGARCTFVDATGRRCVETHYLELHHRQPFAQGGGHHEANLALRCAAHNALAAELDFGSLQIAAKRDALRHLPYSAAAHSTCPAHAPPESGGS